MLQLFRLALRTLRLGRRRRPAGAGGSHAPREPFSPRAPPAGGVALRLVRTAMAAREPSSAAGTAAAACPGGTEAGGEPGGQAVPHSSQLLQPTTGEEGKGERPPGPLALETERGAPSSPAAAPGASSVSGRELDGKQMEAQKKKRRKKQRKESNRLSGSTACLLMEMPFAEADIEAEFSTTNSAKVKIKNKRKRTIGKESEEDSLRKKKKNNQDRPNYFISVPITNPKIIDGIRALQDTIIERDSRLSKAMIHFGSFHVTLLVMHLSSEAVIDNAVDGFLESKELIEELLQEKPLNLSFQGTDHFRNEVGFVKLAESHHASTLLKIAEIVKKILQQKGIFIGDDKAFKPHLTFMKLSKSPKLRKQGVKKIDPIWFGNFKKHYFGDESMKRLDLCSMLKKKQPNGYYHCESSITIGEKRRAEPDDAELLSLSKKLVENAVLKAVQQYLEETQNKNKQNDCGSPMKADEGAIGNGKGNENDSKK